MILITAPASEKVWERFAVIFQYNQKSTGVSFFIVCFDYHRVIWLKV